MNELEAISRPPQMGVAENIEADALDKLRVWSSRLSNIRDLEEGLREVLGAVIGLLDADKGNVQLLDAERGVLTIVVHRGFEKDFLETFRSISSVDDSACGRALRLRRCITIEDTETDTAYAPFRAAARAAGYRAVISAPIIGSDARRPLGIVSAHFTSRHQPTEHQKRLLNLYVCHAADFIQRYRASEATAANA